MAVQEVTGESYEHFVGSKQFAVLHFWASWNRVDEMMQTRMEVLSQSLPENIDIGRMGIDDAGSVEICRRLGLASIPTVALYRDGQLIDLVVGLRDTEHLTERVQAMMDGTYSERFKRPWWKLW
jgi:thioredoxin 1